MSCAPCNHSQYHENGYEWNERCKLWGARWLKCEVNCTMHYDWFMTQNESHISPTCQPRLWIWRQQQKEHQYVAKNRSNAQCTTVIMAFTWSCSHCKMIQVSFCHPNSWISLPHTLGLSQDYYDELIQLCWNLTWLALYCTAEWPAHDVQTWPASQSRTTSSKMLGCSDGTVYWHCATLHAHIMLYICVKG